jgi:HD-like signal output (HDOD) protein
MPTVAAQLLNLARTEIDIKEAAVLISRDPSLASEILTTANSAWYGLRREVRSLEHAVVVLGIKRLCHLASIFVFRDGLRHFCKGDFDYSFFWSRSVLAATAAQALADSVRARNREEFFLAALLQDIGVLALAYVYPESYGALLEESQFNHNQLQQLERKHLGIDHVGAGSWLQKEWGLPEVFRTATRASGEPSRIEDAGEDLILVQSVAVSGRMADVWINPDTEGAWENAAAMTEQLLKLSREELFETLRQVVEGFPQVLSVLRIPGLALANLSQSLGQRLETLGQELFPQTAPGYENQILGSLAAGNE